MTVVRKNDIRYKARIVFQGKENESLFLLSQKSPQLPSGRSKDEDMVKQKELINPQGNSPDAFVQG